MRYACVREQGFRDAEQHAEHDDSHEQRAHTRDRTPAGNTRRPRARDD